MKPTLAISLLLVLLLCACSAHPTVPGLSAATETLAPATSETATASPASSEPASSTDAAVLPLPSFDLGQVLLPVTLGTGFLFTEGPAVAPDGRIFFSDIDAGRIYTWSPQAGLGIFVDGLSAPNGLAFDRDGSLVVCEGGSGRLVSIDMQGGLRVLADNYNGLRFNEPNDLWIDPQGGIYFSDPVYRSSRVQDGEHVYYLSPDRSLVMRVTGNLVRPNGLVGTPDGGTLYISDAGAGVIYAYTVQPDGSLADARTVIPFGSDGMELDGDGNLYLTTVDGLQIFDPAGNRLAVLPLPENPTNLAFTGADRSVLFITARSMVFSVQMTLKGTQAAGSVPQTSPVVPAGGFTLTSPDVPADGWLPADFTCDGSSATPALAWSGAPEGTAAYAVIMHHVAPDNAVHWYWVLYGLPAEVTSLAHNTTGIGMLGTNSVNDRIGYAPPCSQGPGPKVYSITVYALSAQPVLSVPAEQVDREALLAAIQNITLASAELDLTYSRP